jgi:hypothetical protein
MPTYFKTLPQPLTASQATVRASYWARKRTDEPDGFIIYQCEDTGSHYVVGYAQAERDSHLYQDFDIVDIVEPSEASEPSEPYGSATDTNGTRIVWHHK